MKVLSTILVVASGCDAGKSCDTRVNGALEIVVMGGAALPDDSPGGAGGLAGATACHATVLVENGARSEEVHCRAYDEDCHCAVGDWGGGSYKVTVTLLGATENQNTVVSTDACGDEVTERLVFFETSG